MTPIEAIRDVLAASATLRDMPELEKDALAMALAVAVARLEMEWMHERQVPVRHLAEQAESVLDLFKDLKVSDLKRGPVRGIGDRIWDNGEERRRLEAWSRFLRNHGIDHDPMPEVLDRWPVCRCRACQNGVWELLPTGLKEKLKAMRRAVESGVKLADIRDAVWRAATGHQAPDGTYEYERRRAWQLWKWVHPDAPDAPASIQEVAWPSCICNGCASTWWFLLPEAMRDRMRAAREAEKEQRDA